MLTPSNIIALIQEDAPCVYDILRESYFEEIGDGSAPPTDEELLEQLEKYSGDNHDVHYWSWRYAQMIETDADIQRMIAVFEDNKQKLAPVMDYEYTLKINLLQNVQEFICQP